MKVLDDFVRAAERGDLPAVKRLAKQVKDVNASGKFGVTALAGATFNGHLPVAQWLVREARADVDRRTVLGGANALYAAAEAGEADVVQFLIGAGAGVNLANDAGATPLHIAAGRNFAAAARLLIYSFEAYANVNFASNDGRTPLFASATYESTAVMKLLLAAGAEVEQAQNEDAAIGNDRAVRAVGVHASVACRRRQRQCALYVFLHGALLCKLVRSRRVCASTAMRRTRRHVVDRRRAKLQFACSRRHLQCR